MAAAAFWARSAQLAGQVALTPTMSIVMQSRVSSHEKKKAVGVDNIAAEKAESIAVTSSASNKTSFHSKVSGGGTLRKSFHG